MAVWVCSQISDSQDILALGPKPEGLDSSLYQEAPQETISKAIIGGMHGRVKL